ncbi:MAG: hypothetical protein JWP92_730 [Caulobacter sp.]|jgi:hypothetical protein|nr:hypothetical protein [Caulobacter sp.]
MLTPHFLAKATRVLLFSGSGAALLLMLGPFQGAEAMFGLTDKAAHALTFAALISLAFISYPNLRRADMALTAIMLAGGVELAQLGTGRDGSLADWAAGAGGVIAVYLPGQIERLRYLAREHGDISFAALKANDRRSRTQFLGVDFARRQQKAPGLRRGA